MFVDKVVVTVKSGKGGAGCVSFRREKFVNKGGPDGGDGGKGGDIVFEVDNNTDTLSWFKGKRVLKAKNGQPGMGSKKTGKSAPSLILKVPPGTQIFDNNTNELLLDLVEVGERKVLLEGGIGGKGNWHFRNAKNQAPTYAQPGLPGSELEIRLELKLIADVGLVGFPNVGKSTLISVVSNAKPEIANYEFTTLTPNLGIVNVGEFNSFVMADIPGIIEGASEGKGLGLEFLKRIERTKTNLFVLDLSHYLSLNEQFEKLQKELKKYSNKLFQNKFAIIITKIDVFDKENVNKKVEEFLKYLNLERILTNNFGFNDKFYYFIQDTTIKYQENKPYFVLPISSVAKINIESLKFALYELINQKNKESESE